MRDEGDLCTQAGAHELARRIEAYWRKGGYTSVVTFVERKIKSTTGGEIYGVRSNLVDGLPPR